MEKFSLCTLFLLITMMFARIAYSQEQAYYPDPDPLIQKRIEEWKDLKFGLLMHWGPYSQWGIVESWSICPEDVSWATGARIAKDSVSDYFTYLKNYENLKSSFNPVKFDPQRWAKAASDAGMKYVVFTTKHHDGFCMFDTKTTDYKVTDPACPFSANAKADVTKEIFNAFRNENMWVGAYFSKPDWHSQYYWWNRFPPLDRNVNYPIKHYPDRWKKFVDYTYSQIDELVSNYGKLDILWLDGGWVRKKTEDEEKQAMADAFRVYGFGVNAISQDINMPRLAKLARAKQPQLIIVDRDVPGEQQNYLTPEQHIPDQGLPYPWETCMTMGNSWSYVPNDVYKPTAEIIKKLVDIVSKGGNYLLNIGPSPEGEFDTVAYQRLEEIGKWMKMNSEAIYSTGMYKVFGEGENIRFTQSKDGKTIYVFLLEIPDEKLLLQKLNPSKNAKITMLGSKQRLKWKSDANGTEIRLPNTVVNIRKYARVLKVSE